VTESVLAATQDEAVRQPVGWRVFPYVLARVPALPRSRLEAFRYGEALAAHDQARREAAALGVEAAALAKRVGALVPAAGSPAERHDLLALRRDLVGLRMPATGSRELLSSMGGEGLVEAFQAWLERRRCWRAALAERDAHLADPSADGELRAALREPLFRLHVAQAHPQLADRLDRLPDQPYFGLLSRDRKAAGAALRLLWRGALRPTPNGLLAGTGLAQITSSDGPSAPELASRYVRVRPPEELARWLERRFFASAALRDQVRVRLRSDCLVEEDGSCWAVGSAGLRRVDGMRDVLAVLRGSGTQGVSWQALRARVSADLLVDALDAGVLDWELPTGADDPVTALTRRLTDVGGEPLAAPLAALDGYMDSVHRLRRAAQAAYARPSAPVTTGEPNASTASVDTVVRSTLTLDQAGAEAFLGSVAHYGAGLTDLGPTVEEQVLVQIFAACYGLAARVPLLRFYRDYLNFCQARGLDDNLLQNARSLSRALGVAPDRTVQFVHTAIEQQLSGATGGDPVIYRPDPALLADWGPAQMARLSLRFRAAHPRHGPRFQLVLWGGSRMSLYPRYCDLPFAHGENVEQRFCDWMGQWPDVADAWGTLGFEVNRRAATTRRTIDLPGERKRAEGIAPRELTVAYDEDEERLVLTVGDTGERVRPLFFGLTHPRTMPPLVTLLSQLAGFRRSFLEVVTDAVNAVLVERVMGRRTSRLPELQLGDSILISPETFVVPAAELSIERSPLDRAGFLRMHDRLESLGLPRGLVQVRPDLETREPVWLDLEHPAGTNALLRLARRSSSLMLCPPTVEEAAGLRGRDGFYEVEYYAEIAAGTDVEPAL
jgi:hypothetical protein